MSTFEFNQQLIPQSMITIDDVGEMAIEAWNEEGYYYYLIIKTSLGTCTFAECGPIVPDVSLLPSGFQTKLSRMPFKQDKVEKTINFWLNDRSKKLTEAKQINIEEAIDQFRDLGDYMRNYSEEIY